MRTKRLVRLAAGVFAFAMIGGPGPTIGQQNLPAASKGVTRKPVASLDLGPSIRGMEGWRLQMRVVTFEPGAAVPTHTHTDRPGMAYVLEGAVVDHRGDAAKEYRAGESWTEAAGDTHWVENKGNVRAVLITADIARQP